MSVIDTLVKVSVIVGVALASTGVAYHYVIYIPQRDATLDSERYAQAARTAAAQSEQQARAREQQMDMERKAAAAKYEAEQLKSKITFRYERCNSVALANYASGWNDNCARISRNEMERYNSCISGGLIPKSSCETIYKRETKPENCALPTAIADSQNSDLARSKDLCLKEFQLGLH